MTNLGFRDLRDSDQDGLVDIKDNCRLGKNPNQKDADGDGMGDTCDPDVTDFDKDGVVDSKDNCSLKPNPDQKDSDNDRKGDVCDDTVGSQFAPAIGQQQNLTSNAKTEEIAFKEE